MKVAIITNIPSPYREDLFLYLRTHSEHHYDVIYASRAENRVWALDAEALQSAHFLKSLTITIQRKDAPKFIHIPAGVGRLLNRLNPDVVVASEYNPTALLALHWARMRGKRFISWTDGTLNSERQIKPVQKLARHLIIRHADAYIASSTASRAAQTAYGADLARCHLSFLTVDTRKYIREKAPSDGKTLIFVGQLIPLKGLDLLLSALARVRSPWRLRVAGDGEDTATYRRQAAELGIADRIEFLGFLQREALLEAYATSDVFILPTRRDCFGLVILEAMCAGLPVIASKYADGAADLVKDGCNGRIVDPYRAEEMAEAIDELLGDAALRERMAENSKAVLDEFSLESVSKGFLEAIQAVEVGIKTERAG